MDYYTTYTVLTLAGLLLMFDALLGLYFKFKRLNCELVCKEADEE